MSFSRPSLFLLIPAALFALVPLAGYFAPRSVGILPGLTGLLGFVLWRFNAGQWLSPSRVYFVIAGVIVGLAALSSLWSMDSAFALERAGKIALVLFSAALLFSWGCTVDEQARSLVVKLFPLAVISGGLVCVIDLYSGGGIYLLSHDNPTPHIDEFNISLMNRGVNVFVLLSIPAFYALYAQGLGTVRVRAQFGILAALCGAVLFITHSQSAHVAFILAALVWFIFPVSRGKALLALQGIIVAGMLFAPWLVQLFYAHLAEYATGHGHWLAEAYVSDRLEIWDMVARKALENPLYGFGIEATRHVEAFDTAKMYTPHNFVLHPHNFVIQIWIEFGALGALLAAALMVYIVRLISGIEHMQDRRFALCVFVPLAFVACSAYGLWQGWWLGLMSYMAACVVILRKENASGNDV